MNAEQKAELFKKYLNSMKDQQKQPSKYGRFEYPEHHLFPQRNAITDNLQKFGKVRFGAPEPVEMRSRGGIFRIATWGTKSPRKFVFTWLTVSLLILFSRPIYDIFFRRYIDPASIPPPKDYRHVKLF
ncbi:Uncharacterised protein g6517 [Pycnogonum litorale]